MEESGTELLSAQISRSDFIAAVTRQLGPVLGIIITATVDTPYHKIMLVFDEILYKMCRY